MNEVFGSVCEHTDLFADCESVIRRNRKYLCFIYQMVASPIYGEQMRDIRKSYDSLLNKYAEQLSVIYNCSKDITYPIVLLYISAILDYAVWEEMYMPLTQHQLHGLSAPPLPLVQHH